MTKADKMFEVEGYIKRENINYIIYEMDFYQIVFDKNNETVKPRYINDREYPIDVDDKDILAIYTKMKELGWL